MSYFAWKARMIISLKLKSQLVFLHEQQKSHILLTIYASIHNSNYCCLRLVYLQQVSCADERQTSLKQSAAHMVGSLVSHLEPGDLLSTDYRNCQAVHLPTEGLHPIMAASSSLYCSHCRVTWCLGLPRTASDCSWCCTVILSCISCSSGNWVFPVNTLKQVEYRIMIIPSRENMQN